MKYGRKKILFVSLMILIITLIILLFLQYQKQEEKKIHFEEFSEVPKEGYYEITNIDEFLRFAETVAAGNKYEWCEVWLNEDLDFAKIEGLRSVGLNGEELFEFKGIFNGNGYTIRNLSMENPGGYAGLFANLGGVVKNLQMENCYFEGEVCGAITAKSMLNAVIINCNVDAETRGEISGCIAGNFYGYIFNCVAAGENIAGELHNGWMEQCYIQCGEEYRAADEEGCIDGARIQDVLNACLSRVSGFHGTYDLCLWEQREKVQLTNEKAELMESVSAKIYVNSEELEIKGYYSQNDDQWCIAVPAGYDDEMSMEVKLSSGDSKTFLRTPGQSVVIFHEAFANANMKQRLTPP